MAHQQEQQNILISVVVPFFNTNHNLFRDCLNSILQQTHRCIEIIIIDDGSEECSATFLDEISKLDERIRVHHQENKGVSAARNRGVGMSEGKYLSFVDADDVIVPYFLEEALKIIEKENADEVLGANLMVDSTDDIVERIKNPVYYTLSGEDRFKFRPHLMGEVYFIGVGKAGIGRGPVARLLRTNVVKKLKFDSTLTIGEDQIWNLELLNLCHRICYVDQVWYKYYRNPASVTHKFNPLIIQWCEESLGRIPNYIDMENDSDYRGYVNRLLEELWMFVYKSYLIHKDRIGWKERRKIINRIYSTEPWKEIGSRRFRLLSSKEKVMKSILFKFRVLFLFWDIKMKLRGNN